MKKQYILKTIVVISLVIFALFLAGCTTGDDYIYSDISVSEDGKTITIKAPDESAVDTFLYYGEVPNAHLYGEKFRYEKNAGDAACSVDGDTYDGILHRSGVGGRTRCAADHPCLRRHRPFGRW